MVKKVRIQSAYVLYATNVGELQTFCIEHNLDLSKIISPVPNNSLLARITLEPNQEISDCKEVSRLEYLKDANHKFATVVDKILVHEILTEPTLVIEDEEYEPEVIDIPLEYDDE